jgi:hypothetical protein
MSSPYKPVCKYCNQEVPYRPLAQMEQHNVKVHFCDTCQAEYLFWSNGVQNSISLYTSINDKIYRWTVYKDIQGTLWWVKDPGEPGSRVNRNLVAIKSFGTEDSDDPDFLPVLTPSNIKEKLRTWLIFL